MIIRKIIEQDLAQLLQLYKHYVDENNFPALTEKTIRDVWDEIAASENVNYFVVEENKVIIASCIISITPAFIRGGTAFGVIEHVVVHKQFRRKGLGSQLMKHAIDYGWRKGCSEILLMSIATNTNAHRFYESLGFDPEKKKGFIQYRPSQL